MATPKLSKALIRQAAHTKLEKNVVTWWLSQSDGYECITGPLKDLFYGGCVSGLVSHLIYYTDTLTFYKKHRDDIAVLLQRELAECGCPIKELLRDWDESDPLCFDTHNQNLLAWFGFETAARDLSDRLGLEL